MTNRTAALRAERTAVLAFCSDLDDSEWGIPSSAQGWRVQDVVAHLGSGCHSLFTPAALKMLRSPDIERTNDAMVDDRRSWPAAQVLVEFERWSLWVSRLSSWAETLPLGRVRMPLAELGTFPIPLLLGGAMVFDQHTHLRYDIAPALGRPVPGTDSNRMSVVLEWMRAVLHNQLVASAQPWLDAPVSLNLTGPGGGTWSIGRDGVATNPGAAATAASISAPANQFPEWGTRRCAWRDRDVAITGDTAYAERFLDHVNIV